MAVVLAMLAAAVTVAAEPPCSTFAAIYSDGRALCNTLFGDAFVYTEGSMDEAYTMWFFDESNPNDAVSRTRNATVPETCEIQYFHKTAPGPEVQQIEKEREKSEEREGIYDREVQSRKRRGIGQRQRRREH